MAIGRAKFLMHLCVKQKVEESSLATVFFGLMALPVLLISTWNRRGRIPKCCPSKQFLILHSGRSLHESRRLGKGGASPAQYNPGGRLGVVDCGPLSVVTGEVRNWYYVKPNTCSPEIVYRI